MVKMVMVVMVFNLRRGNHLKEDPLWGGSAGGGSFGARVSRAISGRFTAKTTDHHHLIISVNLLVQRRHRPNGGCSTQWRRR